MGRERCPGGYVGQICRELDVSYFSCRGYMKQIKQYGPPPNPTKVTDSRATKYIEEFGHECWELDALEPQVISELISRNVKKYRNDSIYKAVIKQEREEKSMLEDVAQHWAGVANNWKDIKAKYC